MIFDRHRVVCRVDDHRAGGRNLGHHAAAAHVALNAANTRFDLRVAFRLLGFFLNLLLAHAEILLEFPPLPDQVDQSEDHEDAR